MEIPSYDQLKTSPLDLTTTSAHDLESTRGAFSLGQGMKPIQDGYSASTTPSTSTPSKFDQCWEWTLVKLNIESLIMLEEGEGRERDSRVLLR